MKAAVVDNRINRVDTDRREIVELAEAAGYKVVVHYEVKLDPPHTKNYLPEKKMEIFKMMMIEEDIDKVIISQPLRAHQISALEEILENEITDKIGLVLEIFANKANSIDVKLQIQLAQLKYELPQAIDKLSVAVRGEKAGFGAGGEKVTDVAASDIRSRIRTIESKIEELKKQVSQNQVEEVPRLPIVGYYSAGKSTLFNILTAAERETGAEAFTTMVMKTQRSLAGGYPIDLIDTVGLVDLPRNILSAFDLMLSQVFAFPGMVLCLDTTLPFGQWKSHLADFEDYIEKFTKTAPKVIVTLTKTDSSSPETIRDMKAHLHTQEWLGEMMIVETRMDKPDLSRERFISAFEELFSEYLTEFFYQRLSPSTASKLHNIARIDHQEWHNDGTTSMAGMGPTNLLDELKGEIFT